MSRGPDSGPYTVRVVRALPGGDTDEQDVMTFRKFAGAINAAENIAADYLDEGAFEVGVFVIDRYGVAVHRARGERPVARPAHDQRARIA